MRNKHQVMLRGLPASPGITIGEAYLIPRFDQIGYEDRILKPEEVEEEIRLFEAAVQKAKAEIVAIKWKLSQAIGEERARFLDTQLLVLEDTMAINETIRRVRHEKRSAAAIFFDIGEKVLKSMDAIEDEYLWEREVDIRDVRRRVLRHLTGDRPFKLELPPGKVVVVARDLTPSETAAMHQESLMGFVTDKGGKTSHTAIMARAFEIPAVVGTKEATRCIETGDKLIVDGDRGVVIVAPNESTLRVYHRELERAQARSRELESIKDLPAVTLDGRAVDLSANIEMSAEVESALDHGAEGIGLYRTEFLYLTSLQPPSEDTQYTAYWHVAEEIYPETAIIRSLDLGGDKLFPDNEGTGDLNPFLGWRAIRLSLAHPEVFKVQLRSILKASVKRNVRVMFPMVSSLEELRGAKSVLEEAKQELQAEGSDFDDQIEVGVMIEIPAAAIMARKLAPEVNFFSIGSNDLTQYTLAVDRANERVAYLYEHLHPAVLALIRMVIDAAREEKIWVGVCGEMAGDPLAVPILLGMGIDEFSTPPILVPEVKRIIRALSMNEAREMATHAASLSTASDVRDYMRAEIVKRFPTMAHRILSEVPEE